MLFFQHRDEKGPRNNVSESGTFGQGMVKK